MSRREKIEAMLADDPNDSFLRYSLAMELEKAGENDASLKQLQSLQGDTTPFVPAFFMAGQQLTKLGRIDEARTVLRAGIEHARQQQNSHAAGEMSEFLANLGSYGEQPEGACSSTGPISNCSRKNVAITPRK